MRTYYLVYRLSYDRDFDSYPSYYIMGLYNSETKAKEICDKDFCKNVHYQELKLNQRVFIEL